MNELSLADSLKNEGNFNQSIQMYRKLLIQTKSFKQKADINQKIEAAKRFYVSVINISIGEAFFPVVNTATSRGIVLTGKVSLTAESDLPVLWKNSWEKVKKIAVNFLDNYLFKEIKTVMVLDWGMDRYHFSVKIIPNSKIDMNELAAGSSIELSMFAALISSIFKKNIGNVFAFSGEVNQDFTLSYIEGVKEKKDAIMVERPLVKKFFIPPNTSSHLKIQKEINTLEEVVNSIFPYFVKTLKEKQNELGNRRITLKMSKAKMNSKEIDFANFNLNFGKQDNIDDGEGEKVYKFLQNNIDKCKKCSNGLIISGLTIIYSGPMFVLPLFNHTPKFLAIHYTRAKDLEPNQGVAYIILSNDSKFKPGEMIKFSLPNLKSNH